MSMINLRERQFPGHLEANGPCADTNIEFEGAACVINRAAAADAFFTRRISSGDRALCFGSLILLLSFCGQYAENGFVRCEGLGYRCTRKFVGKIRGSVEKGNENTGVWTLFFGIILRVLPGHALFSPLF